MIRPGGLLTAALAALALATASFGTVGASAAQPVGTAPLLIPHGDLARDCVGDVMLDRGHASRIRYVVWCSVQEGEARFSLRRAEEPWSKQAGPIAGFAAHATATGPGADGSFRCKRAGAGSVRCAGRKAGPTVVRGWISVPAHTRCSEGVSLDAAQGIHAGLPLGCPGTRRWEPRFNVRSIRHGREQLALDADLHGDAEAIERRVRGIIREWKRGEPAARVSLAQGDMPMRAVDQEKWEFDEALLDTTINRLERWLGHRDAFRYWAGYESIHDMDDGGKRIIYVGFTGDQNAWLAAFKRDVELLAPGQIRPFPVQPLYSERFLWNLGHQAIESRQSPLFGLVNSISVATLENKVEVGTLHVARVKRLIAEHYGPDAPFLVVRMGPIEFL